MYTLLKVLLSAVVAYVTIVVSCDFLEFYGHEVWSQTSRTAQCYDWFEHYLNRRQEGDYSEGFFKRNYSQSLTEATREKYNFIFTELGLQPGMALLDAGCGNGKWIEYCQSRGVLAVGLTLSREQARSASSRGLDARVADYRVLYGAFLGKFDRITVLGSSEHLCSSLGYLHDTAGTIRRCTERRRAVWKLLFSYLKPYGALYFTGLVINRAATWRVRDWLQTYLLERHYGGYYSSIGEIIDSTQGTGFEMSGLQDHTADYHWASVADQNHFGHWTINWSEQTWDKVKYTLHGLLTDDHIVHRWLYYLADTWMWQFGGYSLSPLTDTQVISAPVQLKYFKLEKGCSYNITTEGSV